MDTGKQEFSSPRFGPFELDVRTGELRKAGVLLSLPPQPFKILVLLASRAGCLVTRDEIQKQVWGSDTFVDFEGGLNFAVNRIRQVLGDDAEKARYIQTLPRRGYRCIAPVEKIVPAPSEPLRRRMESIAVLPLENLSGDKEHEYFADGMTEQLITTLGKIGSLRVISRTTAMRYKGKRIALGEIARQLNVDTVVEGTVLRAGNRVRIAGQLIDAASDTHLWAESYERDLGDVLALQSEVAQAIAREIQIKMTALDQARLASARPVNPEAYDAYLKGRFYWNKRVPESLKTAIEYFNQAAQKDPTYAPAYSGLADCYNVLGFFPIVPPRTAYPKAQAAAARALELDDTLAEAHASLARTKMEFEWDWTGAERELRRTIELDPKQLDAHHRFSHY